MSQLKVNSIVPVGGLPSGANGGIIQCVQTVKTDTTSQSLTGSSNFFDISGMSVSITPSSNSNKILVLATVSVANNDGNTNTFIQLRRGSTDIAKGTGGSSTNGSFFHKTRDGFSPENITLHFLDSPATTSATTYKVRWSGESGDTYFLNRNASNTNEGMVSVITVMEVTV
mgnify:CR=1 FL=1|tara:strand:- start:57 stop:569 length:513 start_codon:yes stop_codon:yes gene_type:complete